MIFFVSGVPALIYQLIWQRSLFTIYGVNIESITIVVAAFMLGLGIGSSIGGVVSKHAQRSHLLVFGLIELCIGAFGFASLGLFSWVGELTLGASMLETGLLTFGLVLFPTVLMGATLPILVAFLVGLSGNVGRSVGLLYFVNTLGSAVSCFIAARWLFGLLGKQGAVTLAASLNIAVGVGAIVSHWRIENDQFHLNVTIPANTTATVILPARDLETVTAGGRSLAAVEGVKLQRIDGDGVVFAVGSGQYQFASKLP